MGKGWKKIGLGWIQRERKKEIRIFLLTDIFLTGMTTYQLMLKQRSEKRIGTIMNFKFNGQKPLRPAEFAEQQLLEAILNQEYKPGTLLPGERVLANSLGITRPTLRETLQRLSKEGWITIRQGKPTRVNDYLKEGGLSLLGSMARYGKDLSYDMVLYLLEVRIALLPGVVRLAVEQNPQALIDYLKKSTLLKNDSKEYAEYDWGLQMLMVTLTENPLFRLVLNDFTPMYNILGKLYFQEKEARAFSLNFYGDFMDAIENGGKEAENVVRRTMESTVAIWKKGQNY